MAAPKYTIILDDDERGKRSGYFGELLSGRISSSKDRDFICVDLKAGQQVVFELQGLSKAYFQEISLKSQADSIPVPFFVKSHLKEKSLVFTASQDGKYELEIRGAATGWSSWYDLKIQDIGCYNIDNAINVPHEFWSIQNKSRLELNEYRFFLDSLAETSHYSFGKLLVASEIGWGAVDAYDFKIKSGVSTFSTKELSGVDFEVDFELAVNKAINFWNHLIIGKTSANHNSKSLDELLINFTQVAEPKAGHESAYAYASAGGRVMADGLASQALISINMQNITEAIKKSTQPGQDKFDTGSLTNILIHEVAHALGFSSSILERHNLLKKDAEGKFTHEYVGYNAVKIYNQLSKNSVDSILMDDSNAHWREDLSYFSNELMSPKANRNDIDSMFVSPVTLGVLSDLGYIIDYSALGM